MRVVIVVKPAGHPEHGRHAEGGDAQDEGDGRGPGEDGAQQRQRDAAEGRQGVGAGCPRGPLEVGLGARGEAGHHDEVGDRRRLHAQHDDDAERTDERRRGEPQQVVEDAPGSVGVQPADGRHVAGHDERQQHGSAQATPSGHVRAFGEDGQAATQQDGQDRRRPGSSRARRRWPGRPWPRRGERRDPVLEGGPQQRHQGQDHQQDGCQEQAHQGQPLRDTTMPRAHRAGRAASTREPVPGDPPSRADPTRTWPERSSVTEDGAVPLQQLRLLSEEGGPVRRHGGALRGPLHVGRTGCQPLAAMAAWPSGETRKSMKVRAASASGLAATTAAGL